MRMRKNSPERREVEGGWRKEEGKGASAGETRLLYLAKAAGGRARALPDAGGRSFLMRACRLVLYFKKIIILFIKYKKKEFI